MKKRYQSIIVFLLIIVFLFSGCTIISQQEDAQKIAKANAQMQAFLSTYPNADVTSTYYTKEESEEATIEIKKICGRNLTKRELYKVTAVDLDLGASMVVWIDSEQKNILCLNKKGVPSTRLSSGSPNYTEPYNNTKPDYNNTDYNRTERYNNTKNTYQENNTNYTVQNYTKTINFNYESRDINYTETNHTNYTEPYNNTNDTYPKYNNTKPDYNNTNYSNNKS